MKILKLNFDDQIPKNYTGIIEWPNENKSWFKNGKFHREDGPAIEHVSGHKWWYIDGKKHRLDGPAASYPNGTEYWCKNEIFHRTDGPAIISVDSFGVKNCQWFIDGIEYKEEIDITAKIYVVKEKGRYDLEWLKFMTGNGIEEFPIIPGLNYKITQPLKDFLKFYD